MAQPDAKQLLSDGLADALGFLGGGLAGWQLGRLLGVDITTASGLTVATVSSTLMRLEMKRLIRALPGRRYVRLV